MTFKLKITAIILVVLPALSSCRAISSFLSNEEVVAAVGSEKLYRSDLDKVIPKGLAAEDSSRMARQYINTWASDLVYLGVAQEQLSKADRDVTKELEDYRKSLLKYRYEQLYVNERLDTAVSDDKVEEYYAAHEDRFILQRPVVAVHHLPVYINNVLLAVVTFLYRVDRIQIGDYKMQHRDTRHNQANRKQDFSQAALFLDTTHNHRRQVGPQQGQQHRQEGNHQGTHHNQRMLSQGILHYVTTILYHRVLAL